MLTKEQYSDYCKRFKKAWGFLQKHSCKKETVIKAICEFREYDISRMFGILDTAGFIFINEGTCDYEKLKSLGDDLGLFTEKGRFLLENRFIFPVYDMVGNVIALIGWFPDEKKYITTPSKFFSKDCLFFGLEQLSTTGLNKNYIIVEGIFDSLSIRSLGIPCIAMMGISSSRYKILMYSLFKQLVAIPDADSEGRKVLLEDKWKLPTRSRYVKWSGIDLKDIDDLVKRYESADLKEIFESIFLEQDRIVTIEL